MGRMHRVAGVAMLLHLAACGPSRPAMPPGGGAVMPGAEMGPASAEFTAIRMFLDNYQKLRFNGEQRARLEAIQDTLVAVNEVILARIRELMPERPEGGPLGGARRGPGGADREEMRRVMEQVRPLLEEMRRNEDEAVEEALEIFNGPQRSVAKDLLETYRERRRRGPGMGARPPLLRGTPDDGPVQDAGVRAPERRAGG